VIGVNGGSLSFGKKSIYERKESRFYKAMGSGKEHKIIHEKGRGGDRRRRKGQVLGG
jgi:hypothetical protein